MTEEQIEILEATCHPQAVYPNIEPQEAVALLRELQAVYFGTEYCKAISYAIKHIDPNTKPAKVNKILHSVVTPNRFSSYRGSYKQIEKINIKERK